MMSGTLYVCGLFEQELVNKGIMKEGRCRDCMNYEGFKSRGELFIICVKDGKKRRLEKERTDCPDWVIDTR